MSGNWNAYCEMRQKGNRQESGWGRLGRGMVGKGLKQGRKEATEFEMTRVKIEDDLSKGKLFCSTSNSK